MGSNPRKTFIFPIPKCTMCTTTGSTEVPLQAPGLQPSSTALFCRQSKTLFNAKIKYIFIAAKMLNFFHIFLFTADASFYGCLFQTNSVSEYLISQMHKYSTAFIQRKEEKLNLFKFSVIVSVIVNKRQNLFLFSVSLLLLSGSTKDY